MKLIFLSTIILIVAFVHLAASSSSSCEDKRCPKYYRYSHSRKKCVCQKSCWNLPNVIQDEKTCKCSCKEKLSCANYQWWDDNKCQCRCYIKPLTCEAPFIWSESSCACQCSPVACPSRQVLSPTTCTCGCADEGAKDFCLSQGGQHEWSDLNCSCSSKISENVLNSEFGSVLQLLGDGSLSMSNPAESANLVAKSLFRDDPKPMLTKAIQAFTNVIGMNLDEESLDLMTDVFMVLNVQRGLSWLSNVMSPDVDIISVVGALTGNNYTNVFSTTTQTTKQPVYDYDGSIIEP